MNNQKGVLYLIPTPLGPESGIGIPDFKALPFSEIRYFIVENIRTARRYLRYAGYMADFETVTFYEIGEHSDSLQFDQYLSHADKGFDIGLLSEAGMPCIADPGSSIIDIAHQKSIRVVPIPGPSSIFLALAASGLNGQRFEFHGYLPIVEADLKKKIHLITREILHSDKSHIFIETPYRSDRLLSFLLKESPGAIKLCIAADITLKTESIHTYAIDIWKTKGPKIGKRPVVFVMGR